MEDIREILANNLRTNRRRLGISQARLAEMSNLSTHFVAMIELSRKFPSPEVLGRIAAALGIASHELFSVPSSSETVIEKFEYLLTTGLKDTVCQAVEKAFADQNRDNLSEKP